MSQKAKKDKKRFCPVGNCERPSSSKVKDGNSKGNGWKSDQFIYGNYPRYYGYRNQTGEDSRLLYMKREWFERKVVLDIGCNAGHLTLRLAKEYSPDIMIGADIDPSLVYAASHNVRNYLNFDDICDDSFPVCFVIKHGPFALNAIPSKRDDVAKFPCNVAFVQANYVLESDDLLKFEQPYFDTVLCLSLTKWIHLNWGDEGLKRLFRRMHANLKPGGIMILEAQPWSSYSRKKKMNENFSKNYNSIKLLPEQFNKYLLQEVGFSSCELIDTPPHTAKGFCRPIYLFTKAQEDSNSSESVCTHKFFDDDDSKEVAQE